MQVEIWIEQHKEDSTELPKGVKVKVISLSHLDEFTGMIGKEGIYNGDCVVEIEGKLIQFIDGLTVEVETMSAEQAAKDGYVLCRCSEDGEGMGIDTLTDEELNDLRPILDEKEPYEVDNIKCVAYYKSTGIMLVPPCVPFLRVADEPEQQP